MSTPDSHKLWSHKKPQPYEISYETVHWVQANLDKALSKG